MKTFICLIGLVFGWWWFSHSPSPTAPPTQIIQPMETPPTFPSNLHQDLTDLTNFYRTESQLPILVEDSRLDASAQEKCNDMQIKKYWSHYSPDGGTPWTLITKYVPNYFSAGENLAQDFESNEKMFTDWMESPSHKKNILDPSFDHIGFGTCEGSEGRLVVQHFTDLVL